MISKLSSLLLVSIFFLSGCTVKSDVIQSDSSISSSQSGASVENNQSEKALESSNSYDYTVAAAFDMVTRGSGNENGFYVLYITACEVNPENFRVILQIIYIFLNFFRLIKHHIARADNFFPAVKPEMRLAVCYI